MWQVADPTHIPDAMDWITRGVVAIFAADKCFSMARYLGILPDKNGNGNGRPAGRKVGNLSVESMKAIIRNEIAEENEDILHELRQISLGINTLVTILQERKGKNV